MTERSALVCWLMATSVLGCGLIWASIVIAAGVLHMRPQPTVGAIVFLVGALVLMTTTWMFARRFRR